MASLIFRFTLNLRYLSSSDYKAVGQFLKLPLESLLRDYTHVLNFETWCRYQWLKEDINRENCTPTQKKISLLIGGLCWPIVWDWTQLASSSDDKNLPICELAKQNVGDDGLNCLQVIVFIPVPYKWTQGWEVFPGNYRGIATEWIHTRDRVSANQKFCHLWADKEVACSVPYKIMNGITGNGISHCFLAFQKVENDRMSLGFFFYFCFLVYLTFTFWDKTCHMLSK